MDQPDTPIVTIEGVLRKMEADLALLVYRFNLDHAHLNALRAQEALVRVSDFRVGLREYVEFAWESDPAKMREQAEELERNEP